MIRAKPCAGYLCYLYNPYQIVVRRMATHPGSLHCDRNGTMWRVIEGKFREEGRQIVSNTMFLALHQVLAFMSPHFNLMNII